MCVKIAILVLFFKKIYAKISKHRFAGIIYHLVYAKEDQKVGHGGS